MTRWPTTRHGVQVRRWEHLPFTWQPGEHVTAIARTGRGKSTVLAAVASLRRHVLAIATKPRDPELARLFPDPPVALIRSWPPPADRTRAMLWPPMRDLSPDATAEQADAIRAALNATFRQGGWTLVVDELHHVEGTLGLRAEMVNLWRMGRSSGVSVLAATQRPAHVSLDAYAAASHLFVGHLQDDRDIDRVAEIVGLDRPMLRATVRSLPPFAWLYVRMNDAYTCITRPPKYPRWPTDPDPND